MNYKLLLLPQTHVTSSQANMKTLCFRLCLILRRFSFLTFSFISFCVISATSTNTHSHTSHPSLDNWQQNPLAQNSYPNAKTAHLYNPHTIPISLKNTWTILINFSNSASDLPQKFKSTINRRWFNNLCYFSNLYPIFSLSLFNKIVWGVNSKNKQQRIQDILMEYPKLNPNFT